MLTEIAIRHAKPKEKSYKLYDERASQCLWPPQAAVCGASDIGTADKEKLLALGTYPDVPLKRAREKRDVARQLVADGIDPSAQRRADKATLGVTFEIVAREWLKLLEKDVKASTLEREKSQLERFVFPVLGSRPVAQITTPEILAVLRKIDARGTQDTAHRVRSSSVRIVRYAIQTGRSHF
jgi:hypothetical protein